MGKRLLALLLLVAGPLAAQPFEEGQHYDRVGTPVTVPDDRVVVTDGFAYPCSACRRFLPHMAEWEAAQPDFVEVRRLPIALQPGWDLFVRAYYTAEVSGIGEESHEAMFRALHDERRQFRNFEDIAGFYEDFGMSEETFVNTSESFAVDARMRQNRNEVRGYGIRSTPTVIVQGKWRVSPGSFSSYQEMIDAIDFLVEREAARLGLEAGEDSVSDEEPATGAD